MKFWNKHPEVRKRCWSRVELGPEHGGPLYGGLIGRPYYGWVHREPYNSLKRQLQANPSKGKFYMMILVKEVWFESAGDAIWFKLSLR